MILSASARFGFRVTVYDIILVLAVVLLMFATMTKATSPLLERLFLVVMFPCDLLYLLRTTSRLANLVIGISVYLNPLVLGAIAFFIHNSIQSKSSK